MNQSLSWRDLLSPRLRMIGFLVSAAVILNLIAVALSVIGERDERRLQRALREARALERGEVEQKVESEEDLWTPSPLTISDRLSAAQPTSRWRVERFELLDAGIKIRMSLPPEWRRVPLRVPDQVRFQPLASVERKEGGVAQGREGTQRPRGTYVRYSSGCFGSCESLEDNIAESMTRRVQRDYRAGLDPHVIYWRVHHQTWNEYALLYRDAAKRVWLVGISTQWSRKWLYPVRCEYREAIRLERMDQASLQRAWERWAPSFTKLCREYQVTSWE